MPAQRQNNWPHRDMDGTKTPIFYLDAKGVPREIDSNFTVAWTEFTKHGELTPMGHAPFACDPERHPDAQLIRDWCAEHRHNPRNLQIIFWLAYIVRNEWAVTPKRTRTQHSKLHRRISDLALELRDAMDATMLANEFGRGHGLRELHVSMLLNDRERTRMVRALGIEKDARDARDVALLVERMLRFPTMQRLLERLAANAEILQLEGPIHPQPAKRGAERGYFVRRMGELFQRRYDERPHEVIAALTTIALGEATDRELVAKLLA